MHLIPQYVMLLSNEIIHENNVNSITLINENQNMNLVLKLYLVEYVHKISKHGMTGSLV